MGFELCYLVSLLWHSVYSNLHILPLSHKPRTLFGKQTCIISACIVAEPPGVLESDPVLLRKLSRVQSGLLCYSSLHSTSTHALLLTYVCTSVQFCSSKQFCTLQPSESRCREQLFCLQNLLLRGVLGKQKIQRHIFLLFFRLNEPVAQQVHCILANILHFFYFLEGKSLPPGLGYP